MFEFRRYENERKYIINMMNLCLDDVMKKTSFLYRVDSEMDSFCVAVFFLVVKYYFDCKRDNLLIVNFDRKFRVFLYLRRRCRMLYRKCNLFVNRGVCLDDFEKFVFLFEF